MTKELLLYAISSSNPRGVNYIVSIYYFKIKTNNKFDHVYHIYYIYRLELALPLDKHYVVLQET